jgi:hypothetical protein
MMPGLRRTNATFTYVNVCSQADDNWRGPRCKITDGPETCQFKRMGGKAQAFAQPQHGEEDLRMPRQPQLDCKRDAH